MTLITQVDKSKINFFYNNNKRKITMSKYITKPELSSKDIVKIYVKSKWLGQVDIVDRNAIETMDFNFLLNQSNLNDEYREFILTNFIQQNNIKVA